MKKLLQIEINPSWSQAFAYAFKSGMVLQVLGSILLFALLILLFVVKDKGDIKQNESAFFKYRPIIGFVLLVASVALFISKPGEIKWNNGKALDQEVYDHYKNESPAFRTFYDSLYENNRLIGAAKKK